MTTEASHKDAEFSTTFPMHDELDGNNNLFIMQPQPSAAAVELPQQSANFDQQILKYQIETISDIGKTISNKDPLDDKNNKEQDHEKEIIVTKGPLFLRAILYILRHWYNILVTLAYAGCIGVLIWYICVISVNFAAQSTSTSIENVAVEQQEFPTVTACNWNQGDESCTYCELHFYLCGRVLPNGTVLSCDDHVREINYETPQGTFRCVQYNYNASSVQMSGTVGYGSSVSLILSVPILKTNFSTDLNDDAGFAVGYGMQVSFHGIGTEPPVFNESNFSPVNVNTYFMLTKTTEVKIKNRQVIETTYWKVRPSTVSLPVMEPLEPGHSIVIISFAYETLSTFALTDQIPYQFTNWLGDLAGMTGTLVGMDVIKLIRAILLVPKCFFYLDISEIWETLVM